MRYFKTGYSGRPLGNFPGERYCTPKPKGERVNRAKHAGKNSIDYQLLNQEATLRLDALKPRQYSYRALRKIMPIKDTHTNKQGRRKKRKNKII